MKKIVSLFLSVVLCCSIMMMPAQAAGGTFSDVPDTHWAYTYIERAFSNGAISGTSYNAQTGVRTYTPGAMVTMAQFCVILTNAFYPDEVSAVPAGETWYYKHASVAQKHRLTYHINGFGTYGMGLYDMPLLRENMAGIIYGVLEDQGLKPSEAELQVAAAKIADYETIQQKDAVAACYHYGILSGVDIKGTFSGSSYMTRAQAAVVYCRLADVIASAPASGGTAQKNDELQITLDGDVKTYAIDKTGRIYITVTGSDNYEYNWTSSNEGVVKCRLSTKTSCAVACQDPGEATVTCTITDKATGKTCSASCTIIVGEPTYDVPYALADSIHVPETDYWSKAPADIQAITDSGIFNAAAETLHDRKEIMAGTNWDGNVNLDYNYGCYWRAIGHSLMSTKRSDTYFSAQMFKNLNGLAYYSTEDAPNSIFTFARNSLRLSYEDSTRIFAPIFRKFTSGMSDKEKAVIMMSAIRDRFDYDYDRYHGLVQREGFTWTNGKTLGICDDFADAVVDIFTAAGIPVMKIIGETSKGDHAWNIVYLDGDFYIIDGVIANNREGREILSFEEHERIFGYDHSQNATEQIRIAMAIMEAANG